MAYADPSRGAYAPVTTAAPAAVLGRLVDGWTRWRTYRRSLAELQALDNATLADLGWNRGELDGMARRTAGL